MMMMKTLNHPLLGLCYKMKGCPLGKISMTLHIVVYLRPFVIKGCIVNRLKAYSIANITTASHEGKSKATCLKKHFVCASAV